MLSGLHNFQHCRLPVHTHINVNSLAIELQDYHDKKICDLMRFGWPINILHHVPITTPHKNHKGAREHPQQIQRYIEKELRLGAVVGPLRDNPFVKPIHLSPLNTRPKKEGVDRRVIVDLSFLGDKSVNGSVDMQHYLGSPISLTYPGVDQLIHLVRRKGRGCALFKRDLKRAYRQIPVDPGDVHLLGYCWEGKTYVDRVLPMGLRSAAYICQRVTNAVTFVCRKHGVELINYLDDFAGAETWDKANDAFTTVGDVLLRLGIQEAPDKAWPPNCVMEFLGIEFHTRSFTLRITDERLQDISQELGRWARKQKANKTELQSLIGKLMFIAKCVRPGRLFINRMLEWLRQIPDRGTHSVTAEFRKDISWWSRFMHRFNGIRDMPPSVWSLPDQYLATDACSSGVGGICMGEFFHAPLPPEEQFDWHINELELAAIMVAIKLWSHKLKGIRVTVYCDNSASVSVLNTLKSNSSRLLQLTREIAFWCAEGQTEIKAVHLAGRDNRVPDWLSRWEKGPQFREAFHQWNQKAKYRQVKVIPHMWTCHADW